MTACSTSRLAKAGELFLRLACEAQLTLQDGDPVHRLAINAVQPSHPSQVAQGRGGFSSPCFASRIEAPARGAVSQGSASRRATAKVRRTPRVRWNSGRPLVQRGF